MVHAAADRFFRDHVLGLPFGADKQNGFAVGGEVGDELFSFLEQFDRFAEVNDVDAVALAENVLLHLRVPALCLVPEVHSGFQQLLHGDRGQAQAASITIRITSCMGISAC